MSRENVDLVLRAYPAELDIAALVRDHDTWAAWLDTVAPLFLAHVPARAAGGRVIATPCAISPI